jgi:hypothetical protein
MNAIGKTFVYLGKESTNIYAFDNHNEFKGGPILTPVFDDFFIIDLLLQHEFEDINLVKRRGRIRKRAI